MLFARRKRTAVKSSEDHVDLLALQMRIQLLETEIALLKQQKDASRREAPLIIEHIHIEHLRVDKIDYETHLGSLGIEDLAGQLNIGANHLTPMPISMKNEESEMNSPSAASSTGQSPRCHIRAKS